MSNLSIVVPALNEEKNISITVNELLDGCRQYLEQFELILVDDGSTDLTGKVMDELAQSHEEVKVIHHSQRSGVGTAYRSGINVAQYNFITMIPGDHELNSQSFEKLFLSVGKKDLVIGYRINQLDARSVIRAAISCLYTHLMNLLFGFHLKDFDSLIIYPAKVLKEINIQSTGYAYQMEMVVSVMRAGLSYTEAPIILNPVEEKHTRSLSISTLFDVTGMVIRLLKQKYR